MASAVTAWSPVIMRTWMPAAWAVAMDALASARGGSTMPTRASSVRSETSGSRSAFGSNGLGVEVALRGGHDPQALSAEALVLGQVGVADLVDGHVLAGAVVGGRRPRQELVRGALDVAADDVLAGVVLHGVEGGHELVGGVEGHLGEARVALAREDRVHAALGGEHDERALRGVAHEVAVPDHGVGAERHRQQVAVERDLRLAGHAGDLARSSSSPRR